MARKELVFLVIAAEMLCLSCLESVSDQSERIKIKVALFQDSSKESLSASQIEDIEEKVNSRSLSDEGDESETEKRLFDLSLAAVDMDTYHDIFLAREVRQLHCKGMASLLTTDTRCLSPWMETGRLSGTPTFRLHAQIPCGYQDSHILRYPPTRSLEGVLRHILDRLEWSAINIYYDEPLEPYVKRLVTTVENEQNVQLKLFKMPTDMPTDAGIEYIHQAVEKGLDDVADKTNNVVICAPNNTLTILEQANFFEEQVTHQRQTLHHSRWLFLVESRDVITTIGEHLQQLDNVAILHLLEQDSQMALDSTVENLLNVISDGISHMLLSTTTNTSNFFRNDATCCHADTSLVWNAIQTVLKNTSDYNNCEDFEAYTVTWRNERRMLRQENLCGSDGKTLNSIDLFPNEKFALSGRHLKVVTIESSPFVMSRMEKNTTVFYGMCIDMLHELSKTLNFTYSVIRSPDGQFGALGPDEYNWTGMVGELQRKNVDLAVASLSVTESRQTVIDFVEYFYEYGGVLMRKPDENENKWRVIVQPFSWQVWVCILASIPLAALIASAISRLVTFLIIEWSDHFGKPNKSVWYVFGAILTQGGEIKPQSSSGRAFICSWWMFCIIIVAAYCGSLIAFLTISKDDAPFTDLESMVSQSRYKWGTKSGSSYATEFELFENATAGIFKKVWQGIKKFNRSDPDVLSKSTQTHLWKVRNDDYAFITDRTPLVVQALADESCRFVVMDEMFMPMPLGVGLQKGSPYAGIFQEGITKIRQIGLINFWQQKWWPRQTCSGIPVPEAHAITLLDTQSAFYLLLAGVVLATFTLALEVTRDNISIPALPRRKPRSSCADTPTINANGRSSVSMVTRNDQYSEYSSTANGNVPHMNGTSTSNLSMPY